MMKLIKQFLKPNWKKITLFLAVFLVMFFELPFVKLSSTEGTKSFFWLIKKYSGQKEIFSIILSGFIIYFIAAYFISCLAVSLWSDFGGKKIWKIKKEK